MMVSIWEGIWDSEEVGDPDTCIIVYGCVMYFSSEPTAGKPKAGKTVT
jgi:hypothetical protein